MVNEPKLVVVTGAGGFIGRALVAHFSRTGRPLRALVRGQDAAEVATHPSRVIADLGAAETTHPSRVVADLGAATEAELDALVAGAAAIVHLAGRAHVQAETAADPKDAYRTANTVATARLARAAVRAGVRRFVFASTVKVNGEASAPGRPLRPDDTPDPRDDYARSKLDAERELNAICAGTPMTAIVLRLPLVYGPGVKGNFAAMLDEIGRGRALPLGALDNRRSLLYVGSLVEAIAAALDAPATLSGVHFVADAQSVPVRELVIATGTALGVPVRLWAIPRALLVFGGRLAGRRALVERLTGTLEVDAASFTTATGWRPRFTLADGLAATAAWWRLRHAI